MPRVGIQKFQIPSASFFQSTLAAAGANTTSAVLNVSDWDQARIYYTYDAKNGTNQATGKVFVSPDNTTFYQTGPNYTLASSAGTDTSNFIDVNINKVGWFKFVANETGNTGAPADLSASLVLEHRRGSGDLIPNTLTHAFESYLDITTQFSASNGSAGGTANLATKTLSVAAVTSNLAQTPYFSYNYPAGVDSFNCSVAIRLAAYTGPTANNQLNICLSHDNSNHTLVGTGAVMTTRMEGSAAVNCFANSTAVVISKAVGTLLFDGQDWIKMVCSNGNIGYYLGRGQVYEAVNWEVLAFRSSYAPIWGKNSSASKYLNIGLTSAAAVACSATIGEVVFKQLV